MGRYSEMDKMLTITGKQPTLSISFVLVLVTSSFGEKSIDIMQEKVHTI